MKPAVIALGHRLVLNEVGWKEKYLINLVETAFFYKPDHILISIDNLKSFLKKNDLLRLDIIQSELENSIQRLLEQGVLQSLPTGGWKITEQRLKNLELAINEWLELERKTKEEWLKTLSEKYPKITESDKQILWNCLINDVVMKILTSHGAETVRIIQNIKLPRGEDFSFSIARIIEEGICNLSLNLKEIANNEFISFFDAENDNRRRYLMSLLDEALRQFAVTLPSEVHQKIRDTSEELILFLDTNFIISALNLRDHPVNESVKDIFILLNKIVAQTGGKRKITLRYVQETLEEFRIQLKTALYRLKDISINKSIAYAALQSEMVDDISLAYFRKVVESGYISPQSYFDPYISGPQHILKSKNIDAYNDPLFSNIKDSEEVIDSCDDFANYLKIHHRRDRKKEQILHDMRVWHYIKKLRINLAPQSFLGNKYFMLTLDGTLCDFEQKYKNQDPVYLLPTRFLHLLSFFISRTDDFEKALIHSLKIPMARGVDEETEKTSFKIINVIAGYQDLSEEEGVNILKDKVMRQKSRILTSQKRLEELLRPNGQSSWKKSARFDRNWNLK